MPLWPRLWRKRREVFAVDGSIKVGVAQQSEHDFDLARGQAGDDPIGAVGVTDAVTKTAGGVVGCCVAADDRGPGKVIEAVLDPLFNGCDWIGSASVIDDDAVVAEVELAAAGHR